jgi:hypothetical protein
MQLSQAKLLLRITGFSVIILAFLPLMFPQLFFCAIEMAYRSRYPGYISSDYMAKCMNFIYHRRDLSVFILAALLFSSGVITALIGCVLKNDKNS